MTNNNIIKSFMRGATNGHTPTRDITNGCYTYKGTTLSIAGDKLINYATIIAIREGNTIKLNNKKYSSTTSKIQNQIRREALSSGLELIEMEEL